MNQNRTCMLRSFSSAVRLQEIIYRQKCDDEDDDDDNNNNNNNNNKFLHTTWHKGTQGE